MSALLSPARASNDDLAERLPDPTRPLFKRLVALPGEIRAMQNHFASLRSDDLDAAAAAEREAARLRSDHSGRTHPQRAYFEGRLDALAKVVERHRTAAEEKAARLSQLRASDSDAARVADNLRELVAPAGRSFVIAKPPAIPRGMDLPRCVDAIEANARQTEAVALAPRDRKAIIEAIHAEVAAEAAKGAPAIDRRRRDNAPVRLAQHLMIASARSGSLIGDGGAALWCWLHHDEIIARLIALVPPDTPDALTDTERDQKLAELARERLALERIEEALIRQAEAEGRVVARRPDADPRAILGVEVVGGGA